jgi:hypothetical protein
MYLANIERSLLTHALGDLDGDGTRSTFEATSLNQGIWVKDEIE